MGTVMNSTNRPVDLDDGRIIGPGEEAKKVNLSAGHNQTLLKKGLVVEIEPKTPTRREPGDTGEDKKS